MIQLDDWTKKDYLIYKNDLEIEKAPEEVVTLYMRVSKSSSAYTNNIILKSNIVNDMGIMYMKENNNTYGFVHNGKIYLNPELMNSNAAIHEYTHLWDAYTQKTNPELWSCITIRKRKVIQQIKEFQYKISGSKIKNEDYTVKTVITVFNNGERYYEHKLSK